MKKRSSLSLAAILGGIAPHLFCCVIPTVLMAANVVFGTTLALETALFDHDAADAMLWFSGAAVLATFVMQRFDHPTRLEKTVLWITAALFFFSLAVHLTAHEH